MAAGGTDKGFKLVFPDRVVECRKGDDVTLRCHLSPETSAVAMEIRWYRGTDCIYLYKKGHVMEGRGYEGRVSVDPQELQRGGVSLRLRKSIWRDDEGVYTCQVISEEHKEEGRVKLSFSAAVDRLRELQRDRLRAVALGARRVQYAAVAAVGVALAGLIGLSGVALVPVRGVALDYWAAVDPPIRRRRSIDKDPPNMDEKITAEERKKMEESVRSLVDEKITAEERKKMEESVRSLVEERKKMEESVRSLVRETDT